MMLCDELKDKWFNAYPEIMGIEGGKPTKCYGKAEVDEAVAELKDENRRLKRALWLARADRAMMTLDYFTLKCRWFKDYMKVEPPQCDVKMVHKWANVERKCRAKAEEYK